MFWLYMKEALLIGFSVYLDLKLVILEMYLYIQKKSTGFWFLSYTPGKEIIVWALCSDVPSLLMYRYVWFLVHDCMEYCLLMISNVLNLCKGRSVDCFVFHISWCKVGYSNLIELCFVFNSYKCAITCSLLPVQIKNILSINLID